MQKITPFLWFDGQAEEAINFYTSIFKNSGKGFLTTYDEVDPSQEGQVMTGTFTLAGQEFMAINGGPMFKFTEAISMFVNCDTQEEVDYFWEALSEGGAKSRCGWLKDKFGLSWQVVPGILTELLHGDNKKNFGKVMQAMMKMDKLDIAALKAASDS